MVRSNSWNDYIGTTHANVIQYKAVKTADNTKIAVKLFLIAEGDKKKKSGYIVNPEKSRVKLNKLFKRANRQNVIL